METAQLTKRRNYFGKAKSGWVTKDKRLRPRSKRNSQQSIQKRHGRRLELLIKFCAIDYKICRTCGSTFVISVHRITSTQCRKCRKIKPRRKPKLIKFCVVDYKICKKCSSVFTASNYGVNSTECRICRSNKPRLLYKNCKLCSKAFRVGGRKSKLDAEICCFCRKHPYHYLNKYDCCPIYHRICICGKQFVTPTKRQSYCSIKCKSRRYYGVESNRSKFLRNSRLYFWKRELQKLPEEFRLARLLLGGVKWHVRRKTTVQEVWPFLIAELKRAAILPT